MKDIVKYILESGTQQMAAHHASFVKTMREKYKRLIRLKVSDDPMIYINHTTKNKCKYIDDTIEKCSQKIVDEYKSCIKHVEYDNNLIQLIVFDNLDNASEAYKFLHTIFIRDIKRLDGKMFDSYKIEVRNIYSDLEPGNTSSQYYFIKNCFIYIKIINTETGKKYYDVYPEICLCTSDRDYLDQKIASAKKYGEIPDYMEKYYKL